MKGRIYIFLFCGLLLSCAQSKKMMETDLPSPGLSQSQDVIRSQKTDPTSDPMSGQFKLGSGIEEDEMDTTSVENQFIHTDESGNTYSIIEASVDSVTGESIGNVSLHEVVVRGKARVIPERKGMVTISFIVSVPASLQNDDWAVRMTPYITRGNEITKMDNILIRGDRFKQVQDGEYKRYQKYLSAIVPDSVDFFKYFSNYEDIDMDEAKRLAEIQKTSLGMQQKYNAYQDRYGMLYNEKKVSSSVEGEYIDHLSNIWSRDSLNLVTIRTQKELSKFYNNRKIDRNEDIIAKKENLYNRSLKYTKLDNLRFDMVSKEGSNIEFHYSQNIPTNEDSRQIFLNIEGELVYLDGTRKELPLSDTIVYYVSSIINFIDYTPKYVVKIVERYVQESIRAQIAFQTGKTNLDTTYLDNASEINRITQTIQSIYEKGELVVDSIMLVAMSSPDGRYEKNDELAEQRSLSLNDYLVQVLSREILQQKIAQDTVKEEPETSITASLDSDRWGDDDTSFFLTASVEVEKEVVKPKRNLNREAFWEARHLMKVGWVAEDWNRLEELITLDPTLTKTQKTQITTLFNKNSNHPDVCESLFRSKYPKEFAYVKDKYYPQLRSVTLDFAMHRKDMVKDTVHTQELDSVYEKGLQYMKDRNYVNALEVLKPYNDINTAICYMSLGRDYTAYDLFMSLNSLTAQAEYMVAILERRMGSDEKAKEHYLKACEMDPLFVYRGNLDPEINELKEMFQLDAILNELLNKKNED